MDFIIEVLKVLVPSTVIFVTLYFLMKQFFEGQEKMRMLELRKQSRSDAGPIKMQAYERLILFLERINPDNLALRTQKNGVSARAQHSEMIRTIRSEFEHNLTQQLYISSEAWALVKRAKEESIRMINVAASQISENEDSYELSRRVISMSAQLENVPTSIAVEGLKKEFRSIYA